MEKNRSITNKFPIIIYFILIFAVIMIFTCAMSPEGNRENINDGRYEAFSDGWLDEDDSVAGLSHLSGTTVIHRELTEYDCSKTLFFFAKTANIRVLVDDECIYENTKFSPQFFGKTPGALFVRVPIRDSYAGKTLYIEIDNPYNDSKAKLDEMYIGSIEDIMRYQMQKRFVSFCLSFIIMALGVGMLIIFIPLAHRGIVGRELLYLGLAALVSGIFLVADGRFLQLMFGNAHFIHVIAETSMQFVIPPFLLFLGRMYKNYNVHITKCLSLMCEIIFAFCFQCEISGYKDYHQTLILTHITFAVSLVFVLISTIIGFVRSPKKDIYHNIGGADYPAIPAGIPAQYQE